MIEAELLTSGEITLEPSGQTGDTKTIQTDIKDDRIIPVFLAGFSDNFSPTDIFEFYQGDGYSAIETYYEYTTDGYWKLEIRNGYDVQLELDYAFFNLSP